MRTQGGATYRESGTHVSTLIAASIQAQGGAGGHCWEFPKHEAGQAGLPLVLGQAFPLEDWSSRGAGSTLHCGACDSAGEGEEFDGMGDPSFSPEKLPSHPLPT